MPAESASELLGSTGLQRVAKNMETEEFPVTLERVELGRKLFDPRISVEIASTETFVPPTAPSFGFKKSR